MRHAIQKFGSYERFQEVTGGRVLSRRQILTAAHEYLRREGMEEEVYVRLSDDLVSRALMNKVKGQPTLNVRIENVREHWMVGLLRHEIGEWPL